MSDWNSTTLHEVADVTVGFVGTMTPYYTDDGVPFLRSQDIEPHRIRLNATRFVTRDFDATHPKSHLLPGDVVTVRTGKPGATAVVPEELSGANCSDVVITRPGPDLDPRWLSYYINGAAAGYISSRLVGAVQQHFNVSAAKQLVLQLPPLAEQKAIAGTLGALDDKIATNRRQVALLNDIANALFGRYFVSGTDELHSLRDYCTFEKGKAPAGLLDKPEPGHLAYLTIGALTGDVPSYAPTEGAVIAEDSDILMVMDGASSGQVFPGQAGIVASTLAKVAVEDPVIRDIVFRALVYYGSEIQRHNTGSAIPHVAKAAVMALAVRMPSEANEHAATFASIRRKTTQLRAESVQLAALRDALLPRLLSGRVRVAAYIGATE